MYTLDQTFFYLFYDLALFYFIQHKYRQVNILESISHFLQWMLITCDVCFFFSKSNRSTHLLKDLLDSHVQHRCKFIVTWKLMVGVGPAQDILMARKWLVSACIHILWCCFECAMYLFFYMSLYTMVLLSIFFLCSVVNVLSLEIVIIKKKLAITVIY